MCVRITDFCSGFVEQIAAGTWPTFLRHDIRAVGSSAAAIFRTAGEGPRCVDALARGGFVRACLTGNPYDTKRNQDHSREFAFSRLLRASGSVGAAERTLALVRRHTCAHRPGARRLLKGAARAFSFSGLHQDGLHTPLTPPRSLPVPGLFLAQKRTALTGRFIKSRFYWMYPYGSLPLKNQAHHTQHPRNQSTLSPHQR